MIRAPVSGWVHHLSKWTPGWKRPGCLRSKVKVTWLFALVWSFCILPFPACACGYCGSFTTLAPLWTITLYAFPVFLIAAIAQKYLLKEILWPRFLALVIILYISSEGSLDLGWILLTMACCYEIGSHLIKAAKRDRPRPRLAAALLFLCYPILVAYSIYHTQQTEGVVFYPKYSYTKIHFKTASVRGQFQEIQKEWESGSATGEKVILPEMDSIPDPFSIYKQPMEYVINASGTSTLLISRGPNLKFDFDMNPFPWQEVEKNPGIFQYDPTNGTASEGDLFIYLR